MWFVCGLITSVCLQCSRYYWDNIVTLGCRHTLSSVVFMFLPSCITTSLTWDARQCASALWVTSLLSWTFATLLLFHSSDIVGTSLYSLPVLGWEVNSLFPPAHSADHALQQRPEPWSHRGQTYTEPSDSRQRWVLLLIRQGSTGQSQEYSFPATLWFTHNSLKFHFLFLI